MMPLTSWEDVIGVSCQECGLPASHYWLGLPYCCQCHGGNIFTQEETLAGHQQKGDDTDKVLAELFGRKRRGGNKQDERLCQFQ